MVYNYDINLSMNNPPTWEVMIIYNEIPFTRNDFFSPNMIDIDVCDEEFLIAAGIDKKVIEILIIFIRENAPIDTADKAYDLDKRLRVADKDISGAFISPNLIKCLSQGAKEA